MPAVRWQLVAHGGAAASRPFYADPRLPLPLSPDPGPQPPARPPTSVNVTCSSPPLTRLSSGDSSCASPRRHAAVTRMARGFRYRPGPSQGAKAAWPPPPHDPSRRLSGRTRRRGASSEISPRDSRPYEIRVVRYCGIHRDGCVSLGIWRQASSEHRDGNDSEMSDTPSANNPLPAPSVSADSSVSEAQGAASSSRQASSEHRDGND